jgi:hypothetical protein
LSARVRGLSPDEDGCEEIIRGNGLFGSSAVREFQAAAKAHNSEKDNSTEPGLIELEEHGEQAGS